MTGLTRRAAIAGGLCTLTLAAARGKLTISDCGSSRRWGVLGFQTGEFQCDQSGQQRRRSAEGGKEDDTHNGISTAEQWQARTPL